MRKLSLENFVKLSTLAMNEDYKDIRKVLMVLYYQKQVHIMSSTILSPYFVIDILDQQK